MNIIERNTWLAKEILVHERALRGYLGRFFKNVADIEDVVQETYARLLGLNDSAATAVRNWHAFLFASARKLESDSQGPHRVTRCTGGNGQRGRLRSDALRRRSVECASGVGLAIGYDCLIA